MQWYQTLTPANCLLNGRAYSNMYGSGNGESVYGGDSETINGNGSHYIAAPGINDAPDLVKFAYWVPNVSRGLVISKIPQRTQ